MKFKTVVAIFLCFAVCGIAYMAFARNPNYAVGGDKNGLVVGKNNLGTKMDFIACGTGTIDNGSTSEAVTVTGVGATDIVVVSINEDLNDATYEYAIPTANTITVHVDQDPGEDLLFSYVVIGVP